MVVSRSVVSQGELARRVGVSAMAISKAVKDGRLHRLPEGIDLEAEKTIDYIAAAKHQRRAGKRQRRHASVKSKLKGKQKAPRSKPGRKKSSRVSRETKAVDGELRIDGESYGEAELRKMIAQANKEEQTIAIRRGELVERSDVKLVFAKVYTIITSQIKTLSEKLGPDITAALGVTEDRIPRVQELMSIDVLRALNQVKKDFNAFLDSIGEGVIE